MYLLQQDIQVVAQSVVPLQAQFVPASHHRWSPIGQAAQLQRYIHKRRYHCRCNARQDIFAAGPHLQRVLRPPWSTVQARKRACKYIGYLVDALPNYRASSHSKPLETHRNHSWSPPPFFAALWLQKVVSSCVCDRHRTAMESAGCPGLAGECVSGRAVSSGFESVNSMHRNLTLTLQHKLASPSEPQ